MVSPAAASRARSSPVAPVQPCDCAQAALADARRDGGTNGEIRLAVGVLDRMHEAVRTRVLHRAIIEAGGMELTAAHTWAVARLVTDFHGQGATDLPGFVTAEREGADLVIRRRT